MKRPTTLLSLILAASGCGQPTIDAQVSTSIAWAATNIACADDSGLGDMKAELWIGGLAPCPLTVDPTTHAASGTCGDVLPGIDRPLVVYYYLENPGNADHALLFCVGFVDLRPDKLPENSADEIDISLCDGPGSLMIYEEAFMASLPAYDSAETDPMERAKMYTRYQYQREIDAVLDSDADGCPNLVEVCNGTLDEVGNTDC